MQTITKTTIPTGQRLQSIADRFGSFFPLRLEPDIYYWAGKLSDTYNGGYWCFYQLSNDGFYLALDQDKPVQISCDNYYQGQVSADAFGIICCLYAYNHLSFAEEGVYRQLCTDYYHRLGEYVMQHPEQVAILAAID